MGEYECSLPVSLGGRLIMQPHGQEHVPKPHARAFHNYLQHAGRVASSAADTLGCSASSEWASMPGEAWVNEWCAAAA